MLVGEDANQGQIIGWRRRQPRTEIKPTKYSGTQAARLRQQRNAALSNETKKATLHSKVAFVHPFGRGSYMTTIHDSKLHYYTFLCP